MLETKRKVIGQLIVCQGCCCGAVRKGRPNVPVEWLKDEWRNRGLLKRFQRSVSGCVGPAISPMLMSCTLKVVRNGWATFATSISTVQSISTVHWLNGLPVP